ncbi:MAG: glycerol-3-phosphate 1-O-acyltransferase PlsY [Candidatus Omnitrophota bacterium]|nr:MAG: glycerol-3-phosphate 1-O-acyltransferase PlsY [Candidatus Omnitrophota bacterium]
MLIIYLVLSYLIGSIPFGFLIAYFVKHINIRDFGSGNIGATNVWRVVGKRWGVFTFILDFLKGFFPLLFAKFLFPQCAVFTIVLIAIAPICGHNWTPFLKFKGGKGVAPSLGAMSGLSFIFPLIGVALLFSLLAWIMVFVVFKYVSLASLSAGAVFFICALILSLPKEVKFLSLCLFVFILVRHKKNIKGLLTKKEYHF